MRVVVAGFGSIGQRHLGNLRRLEPAADITVWRHGQPDTDAVPPGADRVVFGAQPVFEAALDCAIVASPASMHLAAARQLVERGAHVLIEKPIADSMDGIDPLIALAAARGLTLAVGYNFRFSRSLQIVRDAVAGGEVGRVISVRAEVGQYLPDWRPGRDYRDGVSARAALGGGALLELSHEIDYVRWIAGEVTAVGARVAKLSDLQIDVEDTAEVLLEFESGALGSVHLDLVQRTPFRSCKIVGTEGTATWDGISNQVRLFSAASGAWTELHPAASIDRNDMYLAELRNFLDATRGGPAPAVTAADGKRALQIVLAAKEASEARRMVTL